MASILCHTNVSEVVSKYPPKPVSNLTLIPGKFSISLTWEDPEDYTEEGYTCTWIKTVVVRKTGSYPNDIHDGTVVVTTVERNKYKTDPYADSNLTSGITYYYRVFTCNVDGVYSEPSEGNSTPIQYRIMTVKINLNNSNPATCSTYADDAVSMESGKTKAAISAWQDFFGYRVCLFKSGKVVGYLDSNDYSKFENGSSADITSGNAGDVMIEFPRRGIKISKSDKIVTVSMTDDPGDSNFKYYAHQRGSVDKDYFYLGTYIGYMDSDNHVRSLSEKTPTTTSITADTFYWRCQDNGDGYGFMCYYQWLFIQVMYILQYEGNLDSKNAHGYGYNESQLLQTGYGDTDGYIFGGNYSTHTRNKLFGLEDLWGNAYQYINNIYIDNNYNVKLTTDDTIKQSSYDINIGNVYGNCMNGYPTNCYGTTEAGFIPTDGDEYEDPSNPNCGSSSTYFCDSFAFRASCILVVGGTNNGIFLHTFDISRTNDSGYWYGVRLQYL